MPNSKRHSILTTAEVADLYPVPLNGNYSFDFDYKLVDIEGLMRPITDYEPLLKK